MSDNEMTGAQMLCARMVRSAIIEMREFGSFDSVQTVHETDDSPTPNRLVGLIGLRAGEPPVHIRFEISPLD